MSVNVHSFDSYTLGPDDDNLVLEGTANVDGTGNGRNNWIVGNAGNNKLFGLGGDDRLDGGLGADVMSGGPGDDVYIVDNSEDAVHEDFNQGYDIAFSAVSYTLSANVEELRLTGTGNFNGTGNNGSNAIVGNGGNNVLDGLAGDDHLWGGAGNDTYYVDSSGDAVYELFDEGIDTVYANTNTYSLGSNVENLVMTNKVDFPTRALGNELNNSIWGRNGQDLIDGGKGADAMYGGGGNDTYYVDDPGDRVYENADEGSDLVISEVDFTLPEWVEFLAAGDAGITGTGNALSNSMGGSFGVDAVDIFYGLGGNDFLRGGRGDDQLYGGDGNDILYGQISKEDYNFEHDNDQLYGGAGNDTAYGASGDDWIDGGIGVDFMDGGKGDDTYFVAQAGDTIRDESGVDTVHASLTYTLGANIENLIIDAASGLAGFGNALDNQMTGGAGDDYLVGMAGNDWIDGGTGRDGMVGGAGDDTYVVNQVGDAVVEALDEGTDTVRSAVGYTLGNNVENLILTGSENTNGVGNALANSLTGNSGNNSLTGGDGADTFVFLAHSGHDIINDFQAGQNDTIRLVDYTSAIVTQSGSDVLIDMGNGNVITVIHATTADVNAHLVFG